MAESTAEHYRDYDVRRLQQAVESLPRPATAALPRVAILVPCSNDERSIGRVVSDFRSAVPGCVVHVYDNHSGDDTALLADQAGARVRHGTPGNSGDTVRRMFADVDADVYVLADGNGAYDAASAPEMIRRLIDDHLDMVSAARHGAQNAQGFGNTLLTGVASLAFGRRVADIHSGYRVFSRRFVKSFPGLARGFGTEAECTLHAWELGLPIAEIHAPLKESSGKHVPRRNGLRMLIRTLVLFSEQRPLLVFGLLAATLGISALFATATIIPAFLSLACGLILNAVTRSRQEMKRLRYLAA